MLKQRSVDFFKILTGTALAAPLVAILLCAVPAAAAPAGALSGAAASRAQAMSSPMIDAPATATGTADQALSITATGSDPDAEDVLTITATGAPASLSLDAPPTTSTATATLSGTPAGADVGSWSILWSVDDGTGGTATTVTDLTVGPNHDPVVSAPANMAGAETVPMSFAVSVSDPDGDPFTSLTAGALPAGASFTQNAFHTVGGFAWTPAVGQQGSYSVTFSTASGSPARTASATTILNIGPPDHPPVIASPGTVTGRANQFITFTSTASDPDGDPIASLTAEGTQNTALPAGAVWTVNATNTTGVFTWTPNTAQVGNYGIDVEAHSGALDLRALVVTRVNVLPDRAPVVTAPGSVSATEGIAVSVTVTASDPDGQAITSLTASGLPFGATFSVGPGNTSAQFNWTPEYHQAGTYPITFTATNFIPGSATTTITVGNVNRAPTASAGGPYSGVAGIAIAFSAAGSSDPDGDALTFQWDFGDGGTASGMTATHAYGAGGSYPVTVTVTDNGSPALGSTAGTTAEVRATLEARAFTTGGNRTIKLNSGKPLWCALLEPAGSDFAVSDLTLSSVILKYAGNQLPAATGKTSIVGDADGNGVLEAQVCFTKAGLRTLFAGLPSGHNLVAVELEGSLTSGARVHAALTVDVQAGGGTFLASVSPNPFNPAATMSFVTGKPGPLRVDLYDISGRLVRTLLDQALAPAGYHELRIDGRSGAGTPLPSGVYFYRIQSADAGTTGRVSILK